MDATRRARYTAAGTLAALGTRDVYRAAKNYLSGSMKARRSGGPMSSTWISRRKYKKVKELDHPVSRSVGRRHVTTSDAVRDTRTLHYNNLLEISKTAASHNLNTRDRDVINLVGFNLQWHARNVVTSNLLVNYAIIALRSGTIPNTSNFFRGDGSGDRAVDLGTSRTPVEHYMMLINDDDYICIAKGRHKLSPASATDGTDSKQLERWIPCRTQIRYDSTGFAHQPIYLVYWCDQDDVNRTSPAITGALDLQYRVETVYHEVH